VHCYLMQSRASASDHQLGCWDGMPVSDSDDVSPPPSARVGGKPSESTGRAADVTPSAHCIAPAGRDSRYPRARLGGRDAAKGGASLGVQLWSMNTGTESFGDGSVQASAPPHQAAASRRWLRPHPSPTRCSGPAGTPTLTRGAAPCGAICTSACLLEAIPSTGPARITHTTAPVPTSRATHPGIRSRGRAGLGRRRPWDAEWPAGRDSAGRATRGGAPTRTRTLEARTSGRRCSSRTRASTPTTQPARLADARRTLSAAPTDEGPSRTHARQTLRAAAFTYGGLVARSRCRRIAYLHVEEYIRPRSPPSLAALIREQARPLAGAAPPPCP
jgi:hypothetical protein